MTRLRCLQCGKIRARVHSEILVKCREGWTHYNPAICAWCLRVFQGMLEAVVPVYPEDQLRFKLDLRPLG